MQFGKSNEKFIPENIKKLSPKLIRIFLDAFRLGDGSTTQRKDIEGYKTQPERTYFTSSDKLSSDIGELILKVGNYPSYSIQKTKGKSIKHKNGTYSTNFDLHTIRENIRRQSVFIKNKYGKIEKQKYNGKVYDVELPKWHVLYVRYNGKCFWSGNCRCVLVPYFEK